VRVNIVWNIVPSERLCWLGDLRRFVSERMAVSRDITIILERPALPEYLMHSKREGPSSGTLRVNCCTLLDNAFHEGYLPSIMERENGHMNLVNTRASFCSLVRPFDNSIPLAMQDVLIDISSLMEDLIYCTAANATMPIPSLCQYVTHQMNVFLLDVTLLAKLLKLTHLEVCSKATDSVPPRLMSKLTSLCQLQYARSIHDMTYEVLEKMWYAERTRQNSVDLQPESAKLFQYLTKHPDQLGRSIERSSS